MQQLSAQTLCLPRQDCLKRVLENSLKRTLMYKVQSDNHKTTSQYKRISFNNSLKYTRQKRNAYRKTDKFF